MKKTAISLLLVLAMVVGFVLLPAPVVSAAETHPHTANTDHCTCGGELTGKTVGTHTCDDSEKNWKVLSSTAEFSATTNTGTVSIGGSAISYTSNKYTFAEGEHYLYLTADTRVAPGFFAVPENAEVTICLNGYKLAPRYTASSVARIFDIQGGTVNVCDCGSGGQMMGRAGSNWDNRTAIGGVVYLRNANSTLNVFGGEIKYQATTSQCNGGLIYVSNVDGASVNIYGGTLTAANLNAGTSSYGLGDIVYLAGGALNVYGGTLQGSKTEREVKSSIYATANATVNLAGGKIIAGSVQGDVITCGEDKLSLNITKMGLEIAENGSVGVGYITEFTMTDGMKAKLAASDSLNNTAYGLKLWTEGGTPVYAGYADQNATAVGAHLKNIMNKDDNAVDDAANAIVPVKGAAYAVIGKTVVESTTRSFTLKTLVEKMDANLTDNASLAILKDLYAFYENVMSGWTLTKINAA